MSTVIPTISTDEKLLFSLIAEGDTAAFTEIFHKYNSRIYPFVLKMIHLDHLAEEIVQDVFMNLWRNREKLKDVKSPQAYVFTMATNHTLNQLKKISHESRLIHEVTQAMRGIHHTTIEEWMDGKETEHLLHEAINHLPPQRQLVYKLSRQQGKSYKEIAEELNISPKTVQAHLVEAVHSIKQYLQNTPGGSIALLFFICEAYR